MGYLLTLTTVPDREVASKIAGHLVDEQLAACCNIIPGVESVYRWQEAVQRETEVILLIKTSSAKYKSLERRIAELHPYDLPEIIGVSLDRGEARYLAWIMDATGDSH